MIIRKATKEDLASIMPIFDEARKTIAALGIDQWQNGYPSEDVIMADIENSNSYLCDVGGNICATFAMLENGEPMYDAIRCGHWLTGDGSRDYVAVHRVAISLSNRGSGLSTSMIDYAAEHAKRLGKKSLRIDTHKGNAVMRRMLEKNDFLYCGVIYIDSGEERVAYEKLATS